MEDKDIQKDLAKLAPFLDDIKRQRKQEIPDSYFDSLQHKILEQTIDKQVVKPKRRSVLSFIKLAAVVVLLIGAGTWIFNFSSTQRLDPTLADTEILAYIGEHISDFSELEIGENLDDTELSYTLEISEEDILDEMESEDFPMDFFEEQL